MKKLILNDTSNLFILQEYKQPQKSTISTPWGTINEIFVNKILKPSEPAEIGSEAYRASLSRAYNLAKQKIYFNPDMTKFITLTYSSNMQNIEQLLEDVKYLIKKQTRQNDASTHLIEPKYIFVVEKQTRGALHVHMISNNFLTTHENKNNYQSVTNWDKGYSSILDIKGTDDNFRPYLYLFKYMKKSQRIGKSFVHSSKNLNNFVKLSDFNFNKAVHELSFTQRSQQGYLSTQVVNKYYKKRTT